MATLLFITDLYYQAQGREYYSEDVFLTGRLREHFPLVLCHPRDSAAFEGAADLIVFRNAGSVVHYADAYQAFRQRVRTRGLKTYNAFDGNGDMNGKDYLVAMTQAGLPVIPTIDEVGELARLPATSRYVVKPKNGADSIGLAFVSAAEAQQQVAAGCRDMLIQPALDFEYEVSFYFIDEVFQYALYAPDPARRWQLANYVPSADDLLFARRFIDWNGLRWGIQRVDACRTRDGRLWLMELEDLNPFLSLSSLETAVRERFVHDLCASLRRALAA